MTDGKPIVCILGLPGQLYLARAFAKEFDRPVIGIVNWARLEEHLTTEWRAVFANIHSLPDFYLQQLPAIEKLSRAELDRQQAALEEKFNIPTSALLTSYDRGLRWTGDYMKVRRYQLATLQFVDRFLSETEPAFMIDGVVTYLQHVLRAACRKRNIPYLLTAHTRTLENVCLTHDDGQQVGLPETFDALQKGQIDVLPPSVLAEADRLFNEFVNRPATPAYEKQLSETGINFARFFKKVAWVLREENIRPSEKITLTDRSLGYESHPVLSLYSGLRSKYRIFVQKILRTLDDNPDMEQPFFYLPLHYAPEVSDLYFGAPYDHHAGFVSQLAKHLPSDTILYVKEHTAMVGRRPVSFYSELNKIYNVKMIAPSVSTFSIIRKARATVTVTGTAGWEAYLLGRPVIALGDVFYNFLPGVLHAPVGNGLAARIKSYLQDFADNPLARRNAFRAYYGTALGVIQGDMSMNVTAETVADNAAAYARALRLFLEKWGHTIDGAFPPDMKTGHPKEMAVAKILQSGSK